MSNQGQGLLSHVYSGFVCCVLIQVPDIMIVYRTIGPLVALGIVLKMEQHLKW